MLPGVGNESQLLREKAECTSIATGDGVLTMEARCFYKATENPGILEERMNTRITEMLGIEYPIIQEEWHGWQKTTWLQPYLRQAVWD